MMKSLISGVSASKLFREMQDENLKITAQEIGENLANEFPEISPAAFVAIRRWMNPGQGRELPDEQIDGMILYYLEDAGYPVCK